MTTQLKPEQIRNAFAYAVEKGKIIHRKEGFADSFIAVCRELGINADNHHKEIHKRYSEIRSVDRAKFTFPFWCYDVLKEEELV